jgi:hypothetical protein
VPHYYVTEAIRDIQLVNLTLWLHHKSRASSPCQEVVDLVALEEVEVVEEALCNLPTRQMKARLTRTRSYNRQTMTPVYHVSVR